jgi:hypothetical protein
MSFACDRCGRVTDGRWEVEGTPGVGGCCACCGDDCAPSAPGSGAKAANAKYVTNAMA